MHPSAGFHPFRPWIDLQSSIHQDVFLRLPPGSGAQAHEVRLRRQRRVSDVEGVVFSRAVVAGGVFASSFRCSVKLLLLLLSLLVLLLLLRTSAASVLLLQFL